jgi:hypothetical protein
VDTLHRIYGQFFAAADLRRPSPATCWQKLHETSLTQPVQDHGSGILDDEVTKAALD